jgi:hypothetical protein
VFFTKYYESNKIKEDKMDGKCNKLGGDKYLKNFIQKI